MFRHFCIPLFFPRTMRIAIFKGVSAYCPLDGVPSPVSKAGGPLITITAPIFSDTGIRILKEEYFAKKGFTIGREPVSIVKEPGEASLG